jgi:hypothetical protein
VTISQVLDVNLKTFCSVKSFTPMHISFSKFLESSSFDNSGGMLVCANQHELSAAYKQTQMTEY